MVYLLVMPLHPLRTAPTPPIVVDPVIEPIKPTKPEPYVEKYVVKHNFKLPDFKAIRDVKEKKSRFFAFLAPYVKAENKRLLQQRSWLKMVKANFATTNELSRSEQRALRRLYKAYRIKHMNMSTEAAIDELLKCVDALPRSLVLMQAANESAWGTSRFAKLGLNFFGQWCYTEGCGVVPRGRQPGRKYEVEAFLTPADSVRSYFKNINTNVAYKLLREIRANLRENNVPLEPHILATGLVQYSQRGSHYVDEISQMIHTNERYMAD
jgi:Bax protein